MHESSGPADHRPVVVGVDPSDCARHAALWAADLAALWGAPLHLVHTVSGGPTLHEVPEWLGRLVDDVERLGPGRPVAEILSGPTAELLADRAPTARLLVLGSYGSGARSGMLAGSLALGLLGRVPCPVAVVRGSGPEVAPPRGGPVVVGVDGSPSGRAALDLAAGLATSTGGGLLAVRTWTDVVGSIRRPEGPDVLAAEAAAVLDAELDAVAARYPELPVERVLVGDTPVRVLLDRARTARMLVVGHRGVDPLSGMTAGSTSRTLVEFAPCPVVVCPVVTGGAAVGMAGAR